MKINIKYKVLIDATREWPKNQLNHIKHKLARRRAVACSECFKDRGLRIDALNLGWRNTKKCPNCQRRNGNKLSMFRIEVLCHRYFVWGSIYRPDFGGAPVIQFNYESQTDVDFPAWLREDVSLFEKLIGAGFFYYGPHLWMVGEVEPLKQLEAEESRDRIIARIVAEYPVNILSKDLEFYRVRKAPKNTSDPGEYDSPPIQFSGGGRLDSSDLSILYASPDLELCLHECRVTAEDEIFLATLKNERDLKMLNLTHLLIEESVTEFESLDMAVHMLFLGAGVAYPIIRKLALAVKDAGFDGIIYPSYYSLLRAGIMPFPTTYGISHRRLPSMRQIEQEKSSANDGFFGHPIADQKISVVGIEKIILSGIKYNFHFGPVLPRLEGEEKLLEQ